jgi:hypothetical protein
MPKRLVMIRRRIVLGLTVGALVAGCAGGRPSGALRAESLGTNPVVLPGHYITAYYASHDKTETSFFLADVPLEQLLSGEVTRGNVVHLDLLWPPKAGATPMDSSATNVSIRFVVFADGEVGVYGGAGFAVPDGRAGAAHMGLDLQDASLTLLESTDGFVDLLSPARLTGRFTARLNEKRTSQMRYAVSQMVTNALGYSRFVRAECKEVRAPELLIALARQPSSGISSPTAR